MKALIRQACVVMFSFEEAHIVVALKDQYHANVFDETMIQDQQLNKETP